MRKNGEAVSATRTSSVGRAFLGVFQVARLTAAFAGTELRRMGLKARRAEYTRMMARAAVALKALQSMGHVAANMANGVNEIGRPMPLMV